MGKGKILSLLLTTTLALSMTPMNVFAKATSVSSKPVAEITDAYSVNTSAAGLGTDRLQNPDQSSDNWDGSYVYYGMTSRYPIRFRVLDKDSNAYGQNSVLLDADLAIFRTEFDKEGNESWSKSDLKQYLNEDYLLGNFSEPARKALINSKGNGLSGEKIFVLDQAEASNINYGYAKQNARVKKNPKLSQTETASWYLRNSDNTTVSTVGTDGDKASADINGLSWVSPAMNLDPNSIVMTWSSDQTKPSAFSIIDVEPTNQQALTITGGTGFSASRKDNQIVPAGSNIVATVNDIGTADWGVNYNQLSAMLVDKNRNVIAYGPVSDVAATGDFQIAMPAGIPDGDYTLKLFAEDVVSRSIPKAVDYASNVVDMPITVGNSADRQSESQVVPEQTANANTIPIDIKPIKPDNVPTQLSSYKISVFTDGYGTASANVTSATPGTKVQISATPNQGYHIKAWSSAEASIAADGTFNMPNRDTAVYVTFEKDTPTQYKINIASCNGGTVSASKSTAAAGERVDISATPNSGWSFNGWNIPNVATDPDGKYFLMPANDVTINAIFVQNVSLSLSSTTGGTVVASPSNPTPGQVVVLTPVPSAGYHFKQWVSSQVNPGTSNSFVMPSTTVSIQAVFEQDPPPTPTTYTVTPVVNGEGGSIVLNGGTTYRPGDVVSVDVTCLIGAECTDFSVNLGGQSKQLDPDGDFFIMPSNNVTVTATFAPLVAPTSDPEPSSSPRQDTTSGSDSADTEYNVNTQTSGTGSGTITIANNSYGAGATVRVSINTSDVCTRLYVDMGNGDIVELDPDGDSFTMPANNVTVYAEFSANNTSLNVGNSIEDNDDSTEDGIF